MKLKDPFGILICCNQQADKKSPSAIQDDQSQLLERDGLLLFHRGKENYPEVGHSVIRVSLHSVSPNPWTPQHSSEDRSPRTQILWK